MSQIELLVLDVDGCLTSGAITYTNSGDEIKSFDVKDGLAIATWIKMGKQVAIITGRKSEIVTRRSSELGITHIYQGIKNKREKLDEILQQEKLTYENIAAIGDDLNDYHMLKSANLSFTPQNGVDIIKNIVTVTLSKRGGDGAVREMIEYILDRDNTKERFLNQWL
jgi:3-deoxy-D-manno-octulosonate 8-phosphate phosphatase (KDO 8-P phosphatase)